MTKTIPPLIMVINDSQEILMLFEDILAVESGYRVSLHAYNNRDLQDVLEVKPDLIISDHVISQEKQGWQFIQKVRMCRQTSHIPIIICTTNVKLVQNIESQLVTKAISVVFKPFDIDELLRAVREMIGTSDNPKIAQAHPTLENREKLD
jgi:DNA-binding response OmpR family regulator